MTGPKTVTSDLILNGHYLHELEYPKNRKTMDTNEESLPVNTYMQ